MTALKVVFAIYKNALFSSISLPIELLRAADSFARAKRNDQSSPKLSIQIASADGAQITSNANLNILPDSCIEDIKSADIIFLPAIWRNPFPIVKNNEIICGWLKTMFSRETTLIAGVGTGCCFLAEAGLLDDRVATTHWYFFDHFQKRYPKVRLQKKYFITQSDRIYCTGSVNTLADLTVHFISQYYGPEISSEVERHFFHDIRQNYHKLALLDDVAHPHHDEQMIEVQTIIQTEYGKALKINEIAKALGMSRRTLDRRFKSAIGTSPLLFLQKVRINIAKDLLRSSNLSITEIMYEIGYQDSAHFSSLFKKENGVTPRQYRTTVRAKLFQS